MHSPVNTSIITTLAALLSLTHALPSMMPTLKSRADAAVDFTAMALRSASPIHFAPLEACGGVIHLSGPPATFCLQPRSQCPPGNETVFEVDNASRGAALDVVVPGGQQSYIAPDGKLSYTSPHSGATPSGSLTGKFHVHLPTSDNRVGNFKFAGDCATGFVACPVKDKEGDYVVYADIEAFKKNEDGCLGFDAAVTAYLGKDAAVYQYA